MNHHPEAFHIFLRRVWAVATVEWVRFLFTAGVAWLFFYVLRREHWLSRKIIHGFPSLKDIGREAALSVLTCGIYGIVGVLSWMAVRGDWIHPWFKVRAPGPAWFWLSIVLTIFLHDAYFYWTHRLMHLPRLFPLMHRSHHRSTNPTPWAAYAFDPLEAFVQAGIFPFVLCLYSIPSTSFLIFMAWQITFNVLGHSGFEIYPTWFMDSPLGKFLNTPTNHAMHHQYFKGNYGLYFNFWDRLMGTNHSQYEERFRRVTAERRETFYVS